MTKLSAGNSNAAAGRVSFVWTAVLLTATVALGLTMSCKREPQAQAAGAQAQGAVTQNAASFDPPANAPAAPKVDGKRALQYTGDFVAIGPRPLGSPGHKKAEEWIVSKFQQAGAKVEDDAFTGDTVVGPFPIRNIIAKFDGTKDGIVVICGHYDTNYPLRNKNFVGANDGGATTGLMVELANVLNTQRKDGKLPGYSVWFVATDAEEAMVEWSDRDSVYGSKHLSARWKQDGTASKIKALLLLDMIGDKDLDIVRDTNSTPWLLDVIGRAAARLKADRYFFKSTNTISDDHLPFAQAGIPVADIIDLDYGIGNVFHHTTEDTMDKLSAQSLQTVGDVVLETLRALNTR